MPGRHSNSRGIGELCQRLDRAEHHPLHVIHGGDDLGVRPATTQQLGRCIRDVFDVPAVVVVIRLGRVRDEQHANEASAVEHRQHKLALQLRRQSRARSAGVPSVSSRITGRCEAAHSPKAVAGGGGARQCVSGVRGSVAAEPRRAASDSASASIPRMPALSPSLW